jgi:hypothetical protein
MSKSGKKNYRRRYQAQRKRMSEEGVTEENFAPCVQNILFILFYY